MTLGHVRIVHHSPARGGGTLVSAALHLFCKRTEIKNPAKNRAMMNSQNHGRIRPKWFIKPSGLKDSVMLSPGPGGPAFLASMVAFANHQSMITMGVSMHPNTAVPNPMATPLK